MTNIRRYWTPGHLCFLTHVTHDRIPLLVTHVDLLNAAIATQRARSPFEIVAWVILPDHWHLIINPASQDVSSLMRRIKLSFSSRLRKEAGVVSGRIWQNRFWDHVLRDERDLYRHLDYVHYNPVKHHLVEDPFQWQYSSLHDYLREGYYQRDWGVSVPIDSGDEYGE